MKPDTNIDCLKCGAHCKSVFTERLEIINELNSCRISHTFKKGESIYHEGTPAAGIYCIGQGFVKIFNTEIDGSEVILQIAGEGDLINHSSISSKIHHSSAVALVNTRCCVFDTSKISLLLKENPAFLLAVLAKIEGELGDAHWKNVFLVKKNVRERTAFYFQHMGKLYGEAISEGIKINLQLSREDMAAYIGTAHETAIRFISEFKAMGIIKEEKKFFYILNPEGLTHLIG